MSITSIPTCLNDIKDYLVSQNLQLSSELVDGRINASLNEKELLNCIIRAFKIQIPKKERQWFDFAVETDNEFYPVNIKVTETTHADNLNCKLGIYYALTGKFPDFSNEIPWAKFFQKLKADIGSNKDKDYFFLVFNKNNSSDVFVNSLKGLSTLQPNGNNLPFQCKWDDNREFHYRNFDDAKRFILESFGQSIKQRAQIFFEFKNSFPEIPI